MELQKVKTELHKIIDEVKDEKLFTSILRLLKNENEVDSDWSGRFMTPKKESWI